MNSDQNVDLVKGQELGSQRSSGANTSHTLERGVPANGWNVLLELVRLMTWLLQTGNITGLILSSVIIWFFYLTYKASPSTVDNVILSSFSFLEKEGFYLFPLIFALAFTLIACAYYIKKLKAEIKRLVAVRGQLIHGLNAGELTPYKNHKTSGFELER